MVVDGAVAVADGRRVLRFAAPGVRAVAGGGRTAALLFADGVETLDLAPLQDGVGVRPGRVRYPLKAPLAVAVDARGGLFVATRRAVYQRTPDGGLAILRAAPVRWLAAAGPRVWFGDDRRTYLADGGQATPAATGPVAAACFGAGDGSLWVSRPTGLERLVPERASAPERRWEETIRAIFARACADCHRPDGRSGVDLSTAAAWLADRDEILDRVVLRRTMPPGGRPLSEDDRGAVRAWAAEASPVR
jgi:mono/diheme cytochrome c family protein